ncbi:MAG: twin-arginine translocase TatA/TatE family subunit [Solirubrobacteraceae bacterium]
MFRNPITDVIVVVVIVLLFFGPKRLPELGKSLGQGLREFKDGITGGSHDHDPGHDRELEPGELPPVPAVPAAPRATSDDSAAREAAEVRSEPR